MTDIPDEKDVDIKATEELRAIIKRQQDGFYINRIPKQTKEEIIQYANDEYCGDYGMCVKSIWEAFKEDARYAYVIQKLALLESIIYESAKDSKKEAVKGRRMLDGAIKKTPEVENDK